MYTLETRYSMDEFHTHIDTYVHIHIYIKEFIVSEKW